MSEVHQGGRQTWNLRTELHQEDHPSLAGNHLRVIWRGEQLADRRDHRNLSWIESLLHECYLAGVKDQREQNLRDLLDCGDDNE